MSLLVTGSIGIDSVETPRGKVEDVLGGSAIYFSLSAALFSPVRLVGVVGADFDPDWLAPLAARPIDLSGLERRAGSRTFRWHGRYTGAMNEAETMAVELNVLTERGPLIPEKFADSRFVFLANTHPVLQREFAERMRSAELIVCDTMNLWILNENAELRKTFAAVHGVVLNEGEARLLTDRHNLVSAGRDILKMGPKFVIIKKGEHGSLMVSRNDLFVMPAYPTENVVDPTGCGDSFAGAIMGHLAAQDRSDPATLRAAIARGSIVSSFVIESFSVEALHRATLAEVSERLQALRKIAAFE
jgi:sugar/nucleoside kinase (ribokinase family)